MVHRDMGCVSDWICGVSETSLQDWNADSDRLRTLHAEYGQLTVTLCQAVQIYGVRRRRGEIRR